MPLEVSFAALAGLLIGSFLNVCIYRLPRDLSIVHPRSHCPQCDRLVRSWDNIPLVSYLLLRGKCRDCGAAISVRYPLVEFLTAFLFAWFVWHEGLSVPALRDCTLSAIFLALLFTDLETRILPESLTVGGIVVGLIFALFTPITDGTLSALFGFSGRAASFLDALVGAAVPASVLWFSGWVFEKVRHKQGLGFGDVLMISEAGAFLGLKGALLTLVVASVAGTVVGLAYILWKREDASTYELPLGSFLGAAGILSAAFGPGITHWYAGLWS